MTSTQKVSPGKGRWPKSKQKRAIRSYQLKAGGEYKRAVRARDGSQGPASKVRRIDPATGLVIP